MYETCPKCGHRRAPGEVAGDSCPACGVIFAKWLRSQLRPEPGIDVEPVRESPRLAGLIVAHVLHVEPMVNPFIWGGRVVVWLGLLVWSGWFLSTDYDVVVGLLPEINYSFMHSVNLAFHEAGHILFIPFGDFMRVLGGSLFQVLVPLAVMLTFLLKHHNPFGASVGAWWTGQSLMDVAPYINDASKGQILLLGGVLGVEAPGYHDWTNLLSRLGWLHLDHTIAGLVNFAGMAAIVLALAWGAYLLYLQHGNLDRRF